MVNFTSYFTRVGDKSALLEANNILWQFELQVLLFLASVLLFARYKTRRTGQHELCKGNTDLPQPTTLPIIGSAFHLLIPGTDKLKVLVDWGRQFGPIFKVNLICNEFVVLNSPSMIQKVLNSSNPNHLNKHKKIYTTVLPGYISEGIAAADYPIWNPHRKIISRYFTYKSLQNQLVNVNLHTKQFIRDLPTLISEYGQNLPINDLIHTLIIKIVTHNIMDQEICGEEERSIFHTQFQAAKGIVTQRVTQPWLLIQPLWKILPISKRMRKIEEQLETFIQSVVNKYREKSASKIVSIEKRKETWESEQVGAKGFKCLMEELLDAGMSDREIFNESLNIIVGAHETTSWSLTFLFLRLATHLDIQEKCRQEVDAMFEGKLRNKLVSSDLSVDDLAGLKYLERCIQENLRLVPILPLFLRRLDVPLEMDEEITLKSGTTVVICPYALHRDPRVFPNPEKFDPDRFLPENITARHQYSYLPFSAGPRNCIGWKQAMLTIKLVAAWVIRHYDICSTDKWEDVKFDFELTLITKDYVKLDLKKRDENLMV